MLILLTIENKFTHQKLTSEITIFYLFLYIDCVFAVCWLYSYRLGRMLSQLLVQGV